MSERNLNGSERWMSVIAGGVLALWGFRRGTVAGGLAGLVGLTWVRRGLEGRCPVYARLGLSSVVSDSGGAPDPVDEASEESFPASDAPSWTPTHAGPPRRSA